MPAYEEMVNTLFERRLANLFSLLQKITHILEVEHIAYEVIGGLAVAIYVDEIIPEAVPLTRDIDLMIHRSDLERTKVAAARDGFRFRHAVGVDMLIYGPVESARNAVHLVFSDENVTPQQALPNPSIAPTRKTVEGGVVDVIPLKDLIFMKLSSYRLKDQVHIQVIDSAGLITPEIANSLPPMLRDRLIHVRSLQ